METLPTGAGKAGLTFQIGSDSYHQFDFVQDDEVTPITDSTTGWTWEFFIKKSIGDRTKVIDLTLGFGISYVVYSTTSIIIHVSGAQSIVEEGEYYWELRRTDLNEPFMSGPGFFQHEA